MKNFIKISILLFVIFITKCQFAQYGTRQDSLSIAEQLYSSFNKNYVVTEIVNVDSAEIIRGKFSKITDPYNTLEGYIIFIAEREGETFNDSGVVGLYKNNIIIWKSNIIEPYSASHGSILACFDVNNDGKVDIMTTWLNGDSWNDPLDLWIFSWDGTSVNIINKFNEYGSGIESTTGMGYDFADYQGDGIWEIIGYETVDSSANDSINNSLIYSWNGTIYDFSDNLNGFPLDRFFPRNRFTAKVISLVSKKSQNIFNYYYSVKNEIESPQAINEFDVYGNSDSFLNITNPPKWEGYKLSTEISWNEQVKPPYENFSFKYKIKPGTKMEFSYNAEGLPYISDAYLRAFNFIGYQGDESYSTVDDYLNNSVVVSVIAVNKPPIPFIPLSFLDTLIVYCSKSYELNWIKNSETDNKYDSLFISAKTHLLQNNITGAKNTLNQVSQDVDIDSTSNLTSEAYALIKYNTEYLLDHLPNTNTASLAVNLENSSNCLLTGGSLQYYDGGWKNAVNNGDGTFGINTDKTTLSLRMNYEYGSQTVSNVPAQNNTYTFHTTNVSVQLKDSQGNQIDEGTVKYYAGGWRDFGTTTNGVAAKELLPNNYSFRMTYAYGSNDKQQNIGDNSTVVFQTVNVNVQLKNSLGNLIDEGTVKYYAGGWRDFGITTNGVAVKELLPNNYSFRMTYTYGSNDKQQNVGDNPTVVFQTVNANVQLKNSLGNLIDEGTVKYYAGGWRDFGTTTSGVATKELLPNNYSFRMTYAYGSNDKQQNIGDDPTVVFQTVNANVQLKNSLGNLIDQGTVQYYAGGWRDFGTTSNGAATKELLPNNYSIRMNYEFISNDKQQNIGTNSTVTFSTVLCTIDVKESQNQPVDGADIKYYSGGWREIGLTVNGQITKELLPKTLTFRMNHNSVQQDKSQDISANSTVEFNTGE